MAWNPDVYNKFKTERYAPFYDLLALCKDEPGAKGIDLGCGTGELTRILADHLAGYHCSHRAYDSQNGGKWQELVKAVGPLISKWPPNCCHISEEPFREKYLLAPDVFDYVLPKKERDKL